MKRITLLAATALFAGAAAFAPAQAAPLTPAAAPVGTASNAGYFVAPDGTPEFVWRGRVYCFYPDGWRGPGWYLCGYAWRDGYGWGGGPAWRPVGLVWRVRPGGPGWRHGWRGRPGFRPPAAFFAPHRGWWRHGHPHFGDWRHGHPHRGRPHHGHPHHGHGHHGRRR